MGEDTYTGLEREDTRSLCERVGHDYREVSSRVKRWHVDEEKDMPVSSGREDEQISNYTTERTRTYYRADLVTYICSVCRNRVERLENECEDT